MGEGNIEDDFSGVDPGTPHRWEDYCTKNVECSPQSLLGYGKKVHLRSGGVCLYCGFGVSWQVEPEFKFDTCRQLTVEHIVPGQDGKLGRTIKMAVDGFFAICRRTRSERSRSSAS